MNVGISHIECYIPRAYIEQEDAEELDDCPGKYTRGLGQKQMGVWDGREDSQSMALTALQKLLLAAKIGPGQIGRLDAATESSSDAMKPLASLLVELLGGGDVETNTHAGACHGGTLALFAAVAWMQSEAWDGRNAIVVAADTAVYGAGAAPPPGGGGGVAMLIAPQAPLVLEPHRVSRAANTYDVFRPHGERYPRVDGKGSLDCYLAGLLVCAESFSLGWFARTVFHAPFCRMTEKAWAALVAAQGGAKAAGLPLADADAGYGARVAPSLDLARACGNMWTASLYACLYSVLARSPPAPGERILAYSYGSGCACSAFIFRAAGTVGGASAGGLDALLGGRVRVGCAEVRAAEAAPAPPQYPHPLPPDVYQLWEPGRGRRRYGCLAYGEVLSAKAPGFPRGGPPGGSGRLAEGLAAVCAERAQGAGKELGAAPRAALEGVGLRGLLEYGDVRGRCAEAVVGCVALPVGLAGPFPVNGVACHVPLATTEGGLVASTRRGAKALARCGGTVARVVRHETTRAPVFLCEGVAAAAAAREWLLTPAAHAIAARAVEASSRHARLARLAPLVVGRYLHLRISCTTGEAMGMNMVTLAAQEVVRLLAEEGPPLGEPLGLSGNLCSDKKASAVNWLEGRGCSVVVEGRLDRATAEEVLRATPEALCRLNVAKNLVGSAAAGAQAGGFNAHAANVVAAVYVATGQDAAQVVNGAACLTQLELADGGLVATCTLPSLELGSVGGGTHLGAQAACRHLMLGGRGVGGVERLACVLASAVLAAELSLLAALSSGDLVEAHLKLNRPDPGPPPDGSPPPR